MRILSAALVLVLALSLIMPVVIYATEVSVTIDGQRVEFVDQEPIIVDGRTLVPLRGVFEAIGFDVDFDNNTRTAILTGSQGSLYSYYELRVPIGSSYFELNDRGFHLDVPAQIINGRTMLPIRHLLEQIGFNVDWDGATGTVIIVSCPVYRMSHEGIADSLVGRWIVLESDMPDGYHISSFTLNASTPDYLRGDGEVVIGTDRQQITWMINAYRDLLIGFPDALTYNTIEDLNADSLTLLHNGFVIEFVEGIAPHFEPHRAVYTRVR